MSFQTVFKRYEMKYLLSKEQKERVLEAMAPFMEIDAYGRTTIRNIYYDTDSYQLIRRSMEAPIYKEKLRIRSYKKAEDESTVFVEIKKKYDSVVYKRRLPLPCSQAMQWIDSGKALPEETQISREIDYFRSLYPTLHPTVFLTYEREACFTKEPSDFRVTFDDTILCRESDISLKAPLGGIPLLDDNTVLMEIKCSGGIPLWMVHILSKEHIVKTTFSKYGTAYRSMIYPRILSSIHQPLSHTFKEVSYHV